uniref:Retrovirus-related Pol polyprotein from transposon TNT 1-94 n=1 Tax=Tanacetum cinerariifolium TaxID=118510 RepID=A0A699HH81_TANCI|nr:retrovirus-related Pol polyprotein from transposon TNT 1-94 [Tanacetum cinerariifolium]
MIFTRWNEKIEFILNAFKVYYVMEEQQIGILTEEEHMKRNQDKRYAGKEQQRNDKKRKGTWNFFKDNKKPLSEVKLHMVSVTTTTDDWWYESGATAHVCNNKDLFKTYKKIGDRHEVMMGDNHTSKFIGSGNVEIQFTSEKKLTLMNVLRVPNIRKNLVSSFKLCKSGVKAVI